MNTFNKIAIGVLSTFAASSVIAAPAPKDVLDLSCWKVTLPVSLTGGDKPTEFEEKEIAGGAQHPEYFYVNEAGDGVVFRSPVSGVKTSENTKYIRTELRQMMRCGDTSVKTRGTNQNNWVFGSAPEEDQKKVGGVNGRLEVTMSVDEVTTTGVDWQQGRVIIGQIHAPKDEPIKVYYRKLPHHETGSIWFNIEPDRRSGLKDGDITFPVLGSTKPNYWRNGEKNTPKSFDDGIALGEKFSYAIDVQDSILTFELYQEGQDARKVSVDLDIYGVSLKDSWNYFKAGVYVQNRTGEADDYTAATIYDLKVTHDKK
ncbi:polysaccharide lyase family 7 protein [Vibrio hippocampi]|uniref:Alginate lyase n=1 Tax=Vibrio hippocampi TaxID=654686 RepID=A0ABN8DHB9_9VIBR|nr:polysaccharide lyase family 7 protein [Vibrio hippocampi]CAH0527054.1 Alginate lyase [Vibrio hippocampi]